MNREQLAHVVRAASVEGNRSVEVYETDLLDFAAAYLVACAESANVGRIASFDKAIDRVTAVERVEPLLA